MAETDELRALITEAQDGSVRAFELLVNRSNMDRRSRAREDTCLASDPTCHRFDYTNASYVRHTAALELGAAW